MVQLVRHVWRGNRPSIAAGLARFPGCVLLTPTETTVPLADPPLARVMVALESVLRLEPTGLVLDRSLLEARLPVDPGVSGPAPKRAVRKRAARAAKIEALLAELVQHLRSARDHAFVTEAQRGQAELLPRPTQKQLAERTGLSESDVSRCLADPVARELRLYWETALDLGQLMGWKPRPGRRGNK